MNDMPPKIAGVLWWPHSGGRWLCRTLLKEHSQVGHLMFTHPWIFFSTDSTLDLDNTTQVHKTRSLPELLPHLRALITSTDLGRRAGLQEYFRLARTGFSPTSGHERTRTVLVGELCMGTPIPRCPDLPTLFGACPDIRLIHLVRNPVDCFPSFATRHELDADPVRVAGSWVMAMATAQVFFDQHPDLLPQFLMIRYEDLLSDTASTIGKVCQFLEIPFEKAMLDNKEQRWGKSTATDISEENRRIISSVARIPMERYGYL